MAQRLALRLRWRPVGRGARVSVPPHCGHSVRAIWPLDIRETLLASGSGPALRRAGDRLGLLLLVRGTLAGGDALGMVVGPLAGIRTGALLAMLDRGATALGEAPGPGLGAGGAVGVEQAAVHKDGDRDGRRAVWLPVVEADGRMQGPEGRLASSPRAFGRQRRDFPDS